MWKGQSFLFHFYVLSLIQLCNQMTTNVYIIKEMPAPEVDFTLQKLFFPTTNVCYCYIFNSIFDPYSSCRSMHTLDPYTDAQTQSEEYEDDKLQYRVKRNQIKIKHNKILYWITNTPITDNLFWFQNMPCVHTLI